MLMERIVFEGKFDHSVHEIQKAINLFRLQNFDAILGDEFGVEFQGNKQIWFRSSKSNFEKHIFGYLELSQDLLNSPIPISVKIVCCDQTTFYIWMELAQRLQSGFLPGGLGFDVPVPALDDIKALDGNTSSEKSAYYQKIRLLRPEMGLHKPDKNDPVEFWIDYYHKWKELRKRNPSIPKYTLKDVAKDSNRSYSYIRHAHEGCAICNRKTAQQ